MASRAPGLGPKLSILDLDRGLRVESLEVGVEGTLKRKPSRLGLRDCDLGGVQGRG